MEGEGSGIGGAPQVPYVYLSDAQITYSLGLTLDVSMEKGIPGEGMKAGPSLGHKFFASQSFIDCLPPRAPREGK